MDFSKSRDFQQWRQQDARIKILDHLNIMIECFCATN